MIFYRKCLDKKRQLSLSSNHKNNSTACRLYNIQCRYLYFHRYTKQHIFLYTIISYTEFVGVCLRDKESSQLRWVPPYHNTKVADAILYELRSWASAYVIRNPPSFAGSLLTTIHGPGGNRTRVQTGIPCTSTIIVHFFTFPPPDENEHPSGFSSFMIRPCTQSLMHVVSYIVDAWVLKCRCLKSDSCH